MCGIAGIYNAHGEPVDVHALEAMTRVQAHRGPDGEGYVLLDNREAPLPLADSAMAPRPVRHSIGLGHRRLAIVDLSPRGHQPMAYADQRCWVTYNGEIYNYLELREELGRKGHRFQSASDTEVLLAAYAEWGEACLARFNGMFAFALWDGIRGRLFCARDRLGEKPFYYHWDGRRLLVASEIKALLAAGVRAKANQRAVMAYLEEAALDDSDGTFFDGIRQLLPGHWLRMEGLTLTVGRYWDLPEEPGDTPGAPGVFRELFRDAVRLRLRSDVTVGTCLSGGLDSSAIVCVVNDLIRSDGVESRSIGGRQKTFSSCFDDPAYDERRFIQPVLERTGAEPHYTFPDPKELAATLSQLVWQQDEPFASTSIFAQWNVMRLASQRGVKVLLDGQGADELLAGYQSFVGVRLADLLLKGRPGELLSEWRAHRRLQGPLSRFAMAALARTLLPSSAVRFVRGWITGSADWLAADVRRQKWDEPDFSSGSGSRIRRLQHDLLTGNGLRALLRYEDRNAMAFGVETRLPFLDHRLVEFLYRLDDRRKIHRGWTKVVLREAMEGMLPEAVRWRTDKMGFVTPEDQWFRTSLREPARAILSDARTRRRGYLDVDTALRYFEEHADGRANHSRIIWRWLNLELWCRRFLDGDA